MWHDDAFKLEISRLEAKVKLSDFFFALRTKFLQKELRQLRAKWSKESRDQPQPDAPLFERLFGRSQLEVRKEWKEMDRQQDQEQKAEESKSRQKRSDLFKLVNEWKIPGKQEITWRLVSLEST